jgi:hypothetical protein
MSISNGGAETTLGFAIGTCVGDGLRGRYTNSNPGSLRLSLYPCELRAVNIR